MFRTLNFDGDTIMQNQDAGDNQITRLQHQLDEVNTSLNTGRVAPGILLKLRGFGITGIRVYESGLYTLPAPEDMLKATPDFVLKYTDKHGAEVTESVECKNPYYGDDGKTAQEDRTCRPCYVLQTTMQMKALNCNQALLVSSGSEVTRIFPIKFDKALWEMMSEWSHKWFTPQQFPARRQQIVTNIIERAKEVARMSTKNATTVPTVAVGVVPQARNPS